MSLTKNLHPQAKIFFLVQTCHAFWDFYQVCRAYQTREIPTQSHVRLGVFFKNPWILADAKELMVQVSYRNVISTDGYLGKPNAGFWS